MLATTSFVNKVHLSSRPQLPAFRSSGRKSLCCRAEAVNDTGSAKVKFNVTQHVEFGQQVEVTGESETLGLWSESVPLTWNEGDVWTGECELSPGAVEYKYVIKSVDGTLIGWQPGENKVVKVDEPGSEVTVNDGWDLPSVTEAAAISNGASESSSPLPSLDKAENDTATIIEMVVDAAEEIIEDVSEVVEDIKEMEQKN